ncbi:MAG: permease prefix domain 1-containing protein [Clostridiales Family XIII bacterium]|jgi:uncharacterized membrane protein|nr:permease prefix domain 1-containing protein [Clostridiales Family XIII bacterium]
METIINYLENIFAGVPDTPEIRRIKNEMLANMEERYTELKKSGKSENEAVGNVIADFGNVDELLSEMGIARNQSEPIDEDNRPVVTFAEINSYKALSKKASKGLGIGVGFILFGVAALIALSTIIEVYHYSEKADNISAIVFFMFLVCGIGILIYHVIMMRPYEYLEKGGLKLAHEACEILERESREEYTKFAKGIAAGVMLCVGGIIVLIIFSMIGDYVHNNELWSSFGVSIMMILIAIAVYIFINIGYQREVYHVLLRIGNSKEVATSSNRMVQVVTAIIWPLTFVAFLIWGFMYDGWHISWILFPIVGILLSGFSSAVKAYHKK